MNDNSQVIDNLMAMLIQKSGGIEELLENFFSFLGRRTDFFKPPEQTDPNTALEHCVGLVSKYCRQAGAIAIEKRKKEDGEKQKKLANEESTKHSPTGTSPFRLAQVPGDHSSLSDTISGSVREIPDANLVGGSEKEVASNSETDRKADDVPDTDDEAPPLGNGGKTQWYEWTQTLSSLEVLVPVPAGTTSRLVKLKITTNSLHISIAGTELFGGNLYDSVKSDECLWALVDGKTLQISLEKRNGMHWWPCVIKGHDEIDIKRIVPENSKLSDLDPETRATVEKMMFDQRQKAAGLPTSSQSSQFAAFEKFKAAHPELDFSKANINYS